jgi:cysteinyl-tRNA synthetase
MALKLHNTLTGHIDDFVPLSENKVTLYTCGPTVYDFPHVGNWTSFIYWDILVRTLLASGYTVERVMNITDVGHLVSDADDGEDKLEKGARREGRTAWEIAEFYAEDFVAGMEKLGLMPPEHLVKATDFIPQQLDLVRVLKEKGYTYQTTDGIYFDTSKFPTYADFARLDLEAQKAGARVEVNNEKRQAWDFALWKFTPAGETRDMEWETPDDLLELPRIDGDESSHASNTIMGFPGWHLECSAMAMSILGPTIDIHTGGIDHIPVHHTNEIAQSEAASGQPFAHLWLHNNHLKIDGGKVSKSLGNGYTLHDLAERGFEPMDLRMFILQSQYTNEGNFTFDNLAAAKNRLGNWRSYAALRHQTHDRLDDDTTKHGDDGTVSLMAGGDALREALANNLNTPEALKIVDASFARLDTVPLEQIHRHGLISFIEAIDELLGLQLATHSPDIDDEAKRLLLERQRARDNSDWQTSDQLRDELLQRGVALRDTAHGSIWSYL